jgi:hypothetical protein
MSSFFRSVLVATVFVCAAMAAHATNITVDPASLIFPDTYVGVTQGTYVTVRIPTTGSHTVYLSLDDSINFTISPDSPRHVWSGKSTYVQIGFCPKSQGIFHGTLTIRGDSNTVTVSLLGAGLSNIPLGVVGTVKDTLTLNQQSCSPFVFHAANSMPATIVAVKALSISGAAASLTFSNVPQAGYWVHWADSVQFQLCVQGQSEPGLLRGRVRVIFRDSLLKVDSVETTFQTYFRLPSKDQCLEKSQENSSGEVTLDTARGGEDVTSLVRVRNAYVGDFDVDTIYITGSDAKHFEALLYPDIITGHTTDSLSIIFHAPYPYQRSKYQATLNIPGYQHGAPDTISRANLTTLVAYIVDPPSDTTTIQLPDTTHTISVAADTGRSFYQFVFYNGTGSNVHISNVRLSGTDASNFSILTHYARAGSNDTLANGDDYVINISFDASYQGTYEAVLAFTMSNALQDYSFNIVANVGSLGVTARSNAEAKLIISPNPVRGECSITSEGITRAHYSIFGLLGHKIATLAGETWDVKGSQAQHGVYFIRAEGYDLTGQPIVKTARIVLEAP